MEPLSKALAFVSVVLFALGAWAISGNHWATGDCLIVLGIIVGGYDVWRFIHKRGPSPPPELPIAPSRIVLPVVDPEPAISQDQPEVQGRVQEQIPSSEPEPELKFVSAEGVSRSLVNGVIANLMDGSEEDGITVILARFYYPNLNSRPPLEVRAHVFFSKDGRVIKRVFNATWDKSKHLHRRFKTGDAHHLIVGLVDPDGMELISYEHAIKVLKSAPRVEALAPILDRVYASNIGVKIVLIGERIGAKTMRTETELRITLRPERLPSLEFVKHSAPPLE